MDWGIFSWTWALRGLLGTVDVYRGEALNGLWWSSWTGGVERFGCDLAKSWVRTGGAEGIAWMWFYQVIAMDWGR